MSNTEATVEKLYKVYANVPEPVVSYGQCIRWTKHTAKCLKYGELGDGYCVNCWDKGSN